MVEASTPSGWYKDPTGQGDGRYWNGSAWTTSVNRGGVVVDVPIDPERAQQPPFPGTQVTQPRAYVPPAPMPMSAPAPVIVESSPQGHSAVGAILAVVAVVFFLVLMVGVIASNSSDDTSPEQPTETPTTEPSE